MSFYITTSTAPRPAERHESPLGRAVNRKSSFMFFGGAEGPAAMPLPKLRSARASGSPLRTFNRDCLAASISPCPRFERLRNAAREDRVMQYIKHREELKREEELLKRQEVFSQAATMCDYYATLYQPPSENSQGKAMTVTSEKTPFGSSQLPSQTFTLRARDVLLKDVEESFIACYYKMRPGLLERRKEEERMNEMRRQSLHVAKQLASHTSGALQRRSFAAPQSAKRKKEKKPPQGPKEGSPAANLQVLLAALIDSADAKGHITCEAFVATMKRAPFEVHDVEALDAFFLAVRAWSRVPENATESEAERRLNVSSSTSTVHVRGQRWRFPRRLSSGPGQSTQFSPFGSMGTIPTSVKRAGHGVAGSPYASRRNPTSSNLARGATSSVTTGQDVAEHVPSVAVLVQELLAAIDAVINGPELRETVRLFCFNLLENDGFIHKSTLVTCRRTRRGSCEDKSAAVTPSIVKVLCDGLELLQQEEEIAFVRSQTKGKRKKRGNKAPVLLAHQKSAIPLHMMRRSHIRLEEFSRFFDEIPMFAAAFAHAWLPALFAPRWPPLKTTSKCGPNDDGPLEDYAGDGASDEACSPNTATAHEKGALWGTHSAKAQNIAQHRNTVRQIIAERLQQMKPTVPSDLDTAPEP